MKIGCTVSNRRPKAGVPGQPGEQEQRIIVKLHQLAAENPGQVSDAEMDLIRQTFNNVRSMDQDRRKRWLSAIHDDILSPLYFSTLKNFIYNDLNPFSPDPEKLDELRSKDFSSLSKSKDELRTCLLQIFSDFIPMFNLDVLKLQRLIYAISENYQDNPFHNFYHAFSVTQMIFAIGEKSDKYGRFINRTERLGLLLSALGHDLNHPAVTNNFLVNSRHSLAVRYNDISVLENHHAATLIQFLELDGCDVLNSLGAEEKTKMRKLIIPTILATDMAKHPQVMQSFKEKMPSFNQENSEHRQAFMDMVLHSADVGNPTLKFDLATVWSLKIIQEFNNQVWQEEQRGLPVSEHLRVGNEIDQIKRNQVGFIDFVIYPLWKELENFLPEVSEFVESIEKNRKNWEELEKI